MFEKADITLKQVAPLALVCIQRRVCIYVFCDYLSRRKEKSLRIIYTL